MFRIIKSVDCVLSAVNASVRAMHSVNKELAYCVSEKKYAVQNRYSMQTTNNKAMKRRSIDR